MSPPQPHPPSRRPLAVAAMPSPEVETQERTIRFVVLQIKRVVRSYFSLLLEKAVPAATMDGLTDEAAVAEATGSQERKGVNGPGKRGRSPSSSFSLRGIIRLRTSFQGGGIKIKNGRRKEPYLCNYIYNSRSLSFIFLD